MLMRFRGGGVGHKSTRSATDQFLTDRDTLDEEYAAGQQEKDENLQESEVGCPPDEDCELNEPDGDVESTDDDSYGSDEEFDYGYVQRVSDDESEEENDGEGDIDEDGEGGWEDIDELGLGDL
jgi:hypothetical protein